MLAVEIFQAVAIGDGHDLSGIVVIFTGTVLTHLCGGSAGREGAALQIGGSLGTALGY